MTPAESAAYVAGLARRVDAAASAAVVAADYPEVDLIETADIPKWADEVHFSRPGLVMLAERIQDRIEAVEAP